MRGQTKSEDDIVSISSDIAEYRPFPQIVTAGLEESSSVQVISSLSEPTHPKQFSQPRPTRTLKEVMNAELSSQEAPPPPPLPQPPEQKIVSSFYLSIDYSESASSQQRERVYIDKANDGHGLSSHSPSPSQVQITDLSVEMKESREDSAPRSDEVGLEVASILREASMCARPMRSAGSMALAKSWISEAEKAAQYQQVLTIPCTGPYHKLYGSAVLRVPDGKQVVTARVLTRMTIGKLSIYMCEATTRWGNEESNRFLLIVPFLTKANQFRIGTPWSEFQCAPSFREYFPGIDLVGVPVVFNPALCTAIDEDVTP
ncbi:hypothetical protein GMRT_13986 [Giardia muris]|uniref:Uncharacterized protein n=1 Tax=Giardia muris TaxID=5742 RepID=A0A4Z1T1M3_GIAMU|nr:hypothetical protein GMRT_13986 [Giardia muris]|eukprot:TNJ29598.1 hypothetical protein GMRT_13986 [Giardia muris]